MKKSLIVALLFASFGLFAQKGSVAKEVTYQKTINLSAQPITVSEALILFGKEFGLNENYTFKKTTSNKDILNVQHDKFQQFYKGIKVEFGTAIVHSSNGFVSSVNGELYNLNSIDINPSIQNSTAFTIALNKINATSYLWEDLDQAKVMDYKKPNGDLVLYSNVLTGTNHLALKFDIYATAPISRNEVFVDAHTGEVLFMNPIIKHANRLISNNELANNLRELEETLSVATGTAATKYSGNRNIETSFVSGNYVLNDVTRGNGIITYNSARTNTYPSTHFTDNDNNWTSAEHDNANRDNAALDAHWGAEMTYDFWNTIFSRNSYDNNGAQIKSYVHYDNVPGGAGYFNAFWNGSVMTYGDGSTKPLTSIDVCGHEIGHAVCTFTANLAYQNQSGAMNEGFSDIWGACIEHFGRTGSMSGTPLAAVWLIGEDISTSPLRSMSNPLSRGNPDTYLGTNWTTTGDEGSCTPGSGNDNCGVHNNSGVLNHWFYILSAGKAGTNNAPSPDVYNVSGIGINKAAQIAYLAERDYLTPNSTFADARNATIAVASALYCANSPEVLAVTNAWYAVNVGEQYVNAANDVSLETITNVSSITCGTVAMPTLKIKNQGINTISTVSISYTIDGGTPVNTSWSGTLASCTDFDYSLNIGSTLSRGAHILSVTTTVVSDGRPENNTKSTTILVNDAGTVGVVNPFTNAANELISYTDGSNTPLWVRGVKAGAVGSSGNTIYTTNLTGTYPDKTKAYLVSQCYNLSNVSNPVLSFAMKFELEANWDVVYVQYSTNFGATWSVLGSSADANWYNSNRTNASSGGSDCFNCPGAQWTGTDLTLKTYSKALTALNSETNVIFRIVFHSDDAENMRGVNVDDFVINGTLSANDFEANTIGIYPNPSNGIFNIAFGTIKATSIDVYDLTGKKVISNQNISSDTSVLDLTNASQGVYFVKITTDNEQIVKRIIKQ